MAVTQTINGEFQRLAHSIGFSGWDLVAGGGSLTIASALRKIDESSNQELRVDERINILNIEQLRDECPELIEEVDAVLRKMCEYYFKKEALNAEK
jgi:hypothetical protein